MEPATLRVESSERDTNRTAVVLALLHAILFLASLVIIPILAPSARIPNPFGPDEPSRRFFIENAAAIRLSDWLQLASAGCLAALGCVWPRSVQESRQTRRTTNLIAAGSIGSALFLALAAFTSWSLASPGTLDPGSSFRALQFLPFLFGGPGWAAFFALFLFGITQASAGRLPRWMLWLGYGLSVTSALATLVLLTLAAAPFLPLTRFLAFLWLIAAVLWNRKK